MLSERWAFRVTNNSGDTSGQITVLGRTWVIDAASGLAYAAEATILSTTGLANAGVFTGDVQDNGTVLDFGGHYLFTATGGVGSSGGISLELIYYSDAGAVSPSPGLGFVVAVLNVGASEALTTQIEI